MHEGSLDLVRTCRAHRQQRLVLQVFYRGLRGHWRLQRGLKPRYAHFLARPASEQLLHLQLNGNY